MNSCENNTYTTEFKAETQLGGLSCKVVTNTKYLILGNHGKIGFCKVLAFLHLSPPNLVLCVDDHIMLMLLQKAPSKSGSSQNNSKCIRGKRFSFFFD